MLEVNEGYFFRKRASSSALTTFFKGWTTYHIKYESAYAARWGTHCLHVCYMNLFLLPKQQQPVVVETYIYRALIFRTYISLICLS